MPTFTPVDGNPFEAQPGTVLTPVQGNPFAPTEQAPAKPKGSMLAEWAKMPGRGMLRA